MLVVLLSLIQHIGLFKAVLMPNSKKTLGFKIEISHNTKSEDSRFFIISECIISDPFVTGEIASYPASVEMVQTNTQKYEKNVHYHYYMILEGNLA
jgi:hypothetical protein